MRQIFITRAGPPEVLQVRESPDPVPGAGEVRVRVRAAGVNFADVMARLGLYADAPKLPCVVGAATPCWLPMLTRQLHSLLELYRAGAIRPVIDAAIPFAEAPEAHRRLAERRNVGKVVLVP